MDTDKTDYANEPEAANDKGEGTELATLHPLEGEYQEPGYEDPEPVTEAAPDQLPLPLSYKSGTTKYVATCSCGFRLDMAVEDANRILTDAIAYDELASILSAANDHEVDANSTQYAGDRPPPMHPGHTMRYWMHLPPARPGGPATVAAAPASGLLNNESVVAPGATPTAPVPVQDGDVPVE